MRQIEAMDYEVPIEEYPGYLGCEIEREVSFIRELAFLEGAWMDFQSAYLSGGMEPTTIKVTGADVGVTHILVNEENCWVLAQLLDQIPGFEVLIDDGPSDASPAAGRTFVFALSPHWTLSSLLGVAQGLEIAFKDWRS